jgi:RNA polymerase sigma-70 factor, ECF subfamily
MYANELQPELAENAQIQLILDGNEEAFCDLIRPQQRILFLKALSIVRSEADAEEVVQNAVIKAFTHVSQFRQESQFRTWLTSITINEARMWLRKNRKPRHESLDREDEDGNQVPLEVADQRESPFQTIERKQIRAALFEALKRLPAGHSEVFVLRDLQFLSIAETARILGLSETCVKSRLRRRRIQMRRSLAHLRAIRAVSLSNASTRIGELSRSALSWHIPDWSGETIQ